MLYNIYISFEVHHTITACFQHSFSLLHITLLAFSFFQCESKSYYENKKPIIDIWTLVFGSSIHFYYYEQKVLFEIRHSSVLPFHLSIQLFLLLYRMWEFSVALYMINVWPDSLVLAAVYGVVEAASSFLFGPVIGELVDKFSYVKVHFCFLF